MSILTMRLGELDSAKHLFESETDVACWAIAFGNPKNSLIADLLGLLASVEQHLHQTSATQASHT